MKSAKNRIATLAVVGLVAICVSAPTAAKVPDTKGCPGFTSGNNLYWPVFWVQTILLANGINPGQWITGDGNCLD